MGPQQKNGSPSARLHIALRKGTVADTYERVKCYRKEQHDNVRVWPDGGTFGRLALFDTAIP